MHENVDSTEPSSAWNKGCEAYYMGYEFFQCPIQDTKDNIQERKDWESGWMFAYNSCTQGS